MKKIAIVLILLFASLFLSACGSKETQVATTIGGQVTTSVKSAASSKDSAIDAFNKVKEAYNKNDINLLKLQMTKESADAMTAILAPQKGEFLDVETVDVELSQDAVFIKETKEGDKSIITAKVTERDGTVKNMDHVFVKENGVWKLDWLATFERAGST